MNFTTTLADEPNIPFNSTGFYASIPLHICCNGTLSGCNGSNGLEGVRVQACALQWLGDDQHLLPPGQQQYTGNETILRPADLAPVFETYADDLSSDPWPTYDELAPNAMMNCNATSNQMGDDNDERSAWVKDVSFLTLMGLVSCLVIGNWL